jgi:hypothetical protein
VFLAELLDWRRGSRDNAITIRGGLERGCTALIFEDYVAGPMNLAHRYYRYYRATNDIDTDNDIGRVRLPPPRLDIRLDLVSDDSR